MSGGSIEWSSMLIRIMSSICMDATSVGTPLTVGPFTLGPFTVGMVSTSTSVPNKG
jgi:hypothetical protein